MPDLNQDVTTEPSTVNLDVNQVVEPSIPQEPVVEPGPQVEPSVPLEVKPEVIPQPDQRPEINYVMEALRKVNELSESFKTFQTTLQTQPQQPQYSEAELTAYLSKPDLDDSTRLTIARELEKVRQKKTEEQEKRITESLRQQSQVEIQRKGAYDFVVKNFPDCFLRDNTGNIMGFNETHPLTRQIGYYISTHKELAENPAGLMVAAKMAAFDLGIVVNPKMANQLNQVNAQLRKEQKKNLIGGGGGAPPQIPSSAKGQKLLEEYRKTNDPKILAEILKMKGANFQTGHPLA